MFQLDKSTAVTRSQYSLAGSDVKERPSLWTQIVEDWRTHNRESSRPGFRAVAVHRYGIWQRRIKPKLLRAPFELLYRILYLRARNVYGIEIPWSVKLGRRTLFEHQGSIVIHGASEIGDDCIIRQGVTLGNRSLDRPNEAPKLGRGVNVGAGAKILGAVTIGDHAQIGANAVVLDDVAPRTVVVGIPARPTHKTSA